MKPKFLISIIGLNKIEFTKKCIESVLANSGDPNQYVIHLTNNGSDDGTREYFNESIYKCGRVIALRHNQQNEGFIGPNNDAYQTAREGEIPYFICLNNDTEVPPFWLDYLAAPLDTDPFGALSGPGHFSLKADMHGTDVGLKEYIEGSCLCAKVSLVGDRLFSDYLTFIYGDDSDLSLRMQEKGYRIYHTPFHLSHPRCTTVKQNDEVKAKCDAAQAKNHEFLLKRWGHYLKTRSFDYPIVLKRHIACGDTLLLTPIIRALKKSNPLSPIFVETKSGQVLENNPYVAGILNPETTNSTGRDLVIDLEMAYEDRKEVHIIDAYADAVREKVGALGEVDRRVEMFPTLEDVNWAIEVKVRNRFSPRVAIMHIDHGGWPGKNWPKDRFNEVAAHLVKEGWHVVTVGSELPPGQFNAFDLTGKTTAMQLAALLKVSQLFIGGDSFPMHAAVAMGCPTIGIFGVTSSQYIMPEGTARTIGLNGDTSIEGTGQRHREAGSRCVVTTDNCIRSVTVDRVIKAIEELV